MARKALHWVVQRSSASARVAALQLIWRAAVDADLSLWRRSQAEALAPSALAAPPPAPRPHGNVLVELLEDPLVKGLRAGEAWVREPHSSICAPCLWRLTPRAATCTCDLHCMPGPLAQHCNVVRKQQ